jgi:hypothetical protein
MKGPVNEQVLFPASFDYILAWFLFVCDLAFILAEDLAHWNQYGILE